MQSYYLQSSAHNNSDVLWLAQQSLLHRTVRLHACAVRHTCPNNSISLSEGSPASCCPSEPGWPVQDVARLKSGLLDLLLKEPSTSVRIFWVQEL